MQKLATNFAFWFNVASIAKKVLVSGGRLLPPPTSRQWREGSWDRNAARFFVGSGRGNSSRLAVRSQRLKFVEFQHALERRQRLPVHFDVRDDHQIELRAFLFRRQVK